MLRDANKRHRRNHPLQLQMVSTRTDAPWPARNNGENCRSGGDPCEIAETSFGEAENSDICQ